MKFSRPLGVLAALFCFNIVFTAATQAQTTTTVSSSHLISFEGSNNFRDIGGYTTADGKTVRKGILYRSAALNRVTPAGFTYLKTLGIRANVDFRSTDERAKAPVVWPSDMKVKITHVDYATDTSAFMTIFADKTITADKAAAAMAQFYRQAPFDFATQYKSLVHEILLDDTPVVYNCTAGKDRTGVATAVLLTLLGVPRETVIQDYLLSNQYYKPDMPRAGEPQDPQTTFLRSLSPDVIKAVMGVDRSYIEAAFAAIDSRPGGWKRYVHEDLDLSDAQVVQLKAKLLK